MNSQQVVGAKEKISEGIGIVQERQNMIKLADSSDLGWKVVQEYESNPHKFRQNFNTEFVLIFVSFSLKTKIVSDTFLYF
jgi:hypothetical protein